MLKKCAETLVRDLGRCRDRYRVLTATVSSLFLRESAASGQRGPSYTNVLNRISSHLRDVADHPLFSVVS